ncbi:LON peptidase substrate-binding domain-containing protein, partial [Vibrio cholerae]|uniref:LON peptidase substrate-binding domain-containing protein n=1 Tax=Vibrio cholerae TaxID=666 RepID=UPI0015A25B60
LLPGGQLPLNVFEPRYLAMFDAALAGNRLIGMIQPVLGEGGEGIRPTLSSVGCIGRITSFAETGDGRYITSLSGVCRFRLMEEVGEGHPYRT